LIQDTAHRIALGKSTWTTETKLALTKQAVVSPATAARYAVNSMILANCEQ